MSKCVCMFSFLSSVFKIIFKNIKSKDKCNDPLTHSHKLTKCTSFTIIHPLSSRNCSPTKIITKFSQKNYIEKYYA